MKYKTTIGLEIHAALKTKSKMFCDCTNPAYAGAGDPAETRPNTNVCPVCLGHPGVLPTINKRAVETILRIGFALGGQILAQSHFDRKSYFYPDLPKGYQISQYELPLVKGGELHGVKLTRIHLEEDTGRLLHTDTGTLVDYNRAGVPLMELVTEPVISSADEAFNFAKELQILLRYLDASDADMEKGQMRVEANVSLRETADSRKTNAEERGNGNRELGTKVEVKNINSFKAAKSAIEYEVNRQTGLIEKGEKIVQETRGWDENKGETVSQRTKEAAEDYRYMPEPDLPGLDFTVSGGIDLEALKSSVPELPRQKRERFQNEFGLREDQTEVLVSDKHLAAYFEETVSELKALGKKEIPTQLLVNYLTSDLVGIFNEHGLSLSELKISPEDFAELIKLVDSGEVSSRVAKDVLREMFETQGDPSNIIKEKDLGKIEDEETVVSAVFKVIAENEKAVGDYKAGKEAALKFLVGSAMAHLRGRGNPELLEGLFREHLSK